MTKFTIKEAGKPFGDNNDWWSVTLEEHQNEPVLINTSKTLKNGMQITGMKLGASSKGKPMLVPDKPFEPDDKQKSIYWGQAVNLAVAYCPDSSNHESVREHADMYYKVLIDGARANIQ